MLAFVPIFPPFLSVTRNNYAESYRWCAGLLNLPAVPRTIPHWPDRIETGDTFAAGQRGRAPPNSASVRYMAPIACRPSPGGKKAFHRRAAAGIDEAGTEIGTTAPRLLRHIGRY